MIGYGRQGGSYVADGADFMEGSFSPDVLVAGGFDTVYGGADNDTLSSKTPSLGTARMDGELQNDEITGCDGDDRLILGGPGDDLLRGGGGSDNIKGGNNEDDIFGDDGDDELFGELGRDELFGGGDFDICDGGNKGQLDRADYACERAPFVP